jgi:2-methylcitrate synthase
MDKCMAGEEKEKVHRGLKGIYFERSAISFIDGKAGELRYRGYSIHDLAEQSTFEEIAYLLLHGELPTEPKMAAFQDRLAKARQLPQAVARLIGDMRHGHPMDVLRTAASALAAYDPDRGNNDSEAVRRKGLRLTSQIPMIVAMHEALRNGRAPVAPDPSLGHAANLLWQLKGEVPSAHSTKLLDKDLILHAEHGSNASSFAARVVIGTEADLHAAVTAAIAALSGPAHGGAAEDVMRMAQEIGTPENAAGYVRSKHEGGEAVTGFGHRVYRTEDPRARHMRAGVATLSQEMGEPRWFDILQAVVEAMKPYARHGIHVNVDFYSGVIYYLQGIAADLFVPIFAVGRVPGWTAQCLEQSHNNILIRPLTLYDGPPARDYLPLSQR